MLEQGSEAPDFTLQGVHHGERTTFTLSETLDAGTRVLLVFYPADFSPVCTTELCGIRDAEWLTLADHLAVWAISGDTTYAHRAFSEAFSLNFPLLTDKTGDVAERYETMYAEWEGNSRVPMRSVYLVDTDRTVRYAWQTEDAYQEPDFAPVVDAVKELWGDAAEAGDADLEFEGGYDAKPATTSDFRIDHLS